MNTDTFLKSFALFTGIFLIAATSGWGQEQLSLWNFQDVVTATDVSAGITASDVTISAGSIGFQNGADDGGTRIGNSGSWNTGDFVSTGKYLQFSITPDENFSVDLSSISLRFGRTDAGPTQVTVQYSMDGFATAGTTILDAADVSSTNTGSLDAFNITTDLPSEAITETITVRIWGHNASSTGNLRFNNFRVNGVVNSPGDPTLIASPTSLSGFTYAEGTGPSDAQSFELTGSDLDETDVTITAPAAFEVSTHETNDFEPSITLPTYDGSERTIWVRLEAGLSVNEYSGNVVISGGGVTETVQVAVSGEVTVCHPPEITTHPSGNTQELCENAQADELFVTATGDGLTYQWFKNTTGDNAGGEEVVGINTNTYTPLTDEIGTLYYYVVITGACGTETSTVSGAVTVDATTVGGTVSPATAAVCSGANSTGLTLSGHTGEVQKWESSTDGTSWTEISNTSTSYTANDLTTTTHFRAVVKSGVCDAVNSASATITVFPLPEVTCPDDFAVCIDDAPVILNDLADPAGGVYSGPYVGLDGADYVFDPNDAGAGTHAITYTYTESQRLLYYWNFNKNVPAENTNWDQPIASLIGNGEITYTFTQAYTLAGTTLNGIDGEVNGGSFAPRGGPNDQENNGRNFVITMPTTGFENIILSYASQRTTTGFNEHRIEYTVDGNMWQLKETIDNIPSSFGLFSVDFSDIPAANDNPNFAVRIILNGASGAAGNNRFDNIRLEGTLSCTNSCTFEITVNPLPIIDVCPSSKVVCVGDDPFELTDGNLTGGAFSGNGVSFDGTNFMFNPAHAGVATHVITYSLTENYVQDKLVAYWNFNDFDTSDETIDADSGDVVISLADWGGTVNNFGGNTTNALFGDPAGASLSLVSPSGGQGNGSYIQLQFSMVGLSNLEISYWSRRTDNGFNSNQWSWSTTGGDFNDFGNTINPSADDDGALVTIDAPPDIDNVPIVYLRYTLSGATGDNQNNRIDNLQINAKRGCTATCTFTITVEPLLKYRSAASGNWNETTTWQQFNGTDWYPASSYPGETTNGCSDLSAIIRDDHAVLLDESLSFDGNIGVESGGELHVVDNQLLTVSVGKGLTVTGTLTMDPDAIVNGDGSFTLAEGGHMFIGATDGISTDGATGNIRVNGTRTYSAGASYTYNGTVDQLTGDGLTQNIPADLTIDNPGTVTLSDPTTILGNLSIAQGTLDVNDLNLSVGGNWENNGTFLPGTAVVDFIGTTPSDIGQSNFNDIVFSGTGSKKAAGNLTVGGTITITSNFDADEFSHSIEGNWINNGDFSPGTSTITFSGANDLQTISGNSVSEFYNLQVSKGEINRTLEVLSEINITATPNNSLTITSGTFKLSHQSTIYPFNNNTHATIPAEGCFWNNGGTILGDNFSWLLYGLFRLSDGVVNIGNSEGNSLRYFTDSEIIIEGGELNVAARIAKDQNYLGDATTSFEQTGGIIRLATVSSPSSILAALDIPQSNSTFNMSGGTIIFQRGTSNQVECLNLAATHSVTGGVFQFGDDQTPVGEEFRINSTVPLWDLLVNDHNSPTLGVATNTLVVLNDVTIGGTLNLEDQDMLVGGNWTNNGTFTPGTGTVEFDGTVLQNLGGSVATGFFGLTVNNAAGLQLDNNQSVSHLLALADGVINTGSFALIIESTDEDAIQGGSATSHVNGTLVRSVEAGTGIAYNFPIGNNPYTPVEVMFTSGSGVGTITATTTPSNHPQIGSSEFNPEATVNRYWTLEASGLVDPFTYDATFHWITPDDEDGAFDWTISEVGKWTSSDWEYPMVSDRTSSSVTISDQTAFSDFQVANNPPEIPFAHWSLFLLFAMMTVFVLSRVCKLL